MRTKRCTRCQEVKPWSDYCANRKWPDGTMRYPSARCKACDSAYQVQRVQALPAEKRQSIYRRQRETRRANPERLATHRDYQREWARHKRGITADRQRFTVNAAHGGPTVDPGPFVDWLRSIGSNTEQVALAVGLPPRRVHSLFNGEQERVEFDTVDRALIHYGSPDLLNDLYPMEEG